MNRFDALLKVGGSLHNSAALRPLIEHLAALAQHQRLLVLPGGGPFAEQVRHVDAHIDLSDSAAHWMAILSMDQYAYLLADLAPSAALVRDLDSAAAACDAGRLAILAPSTLLLQHDPLPHSWDVTSDTIAAWLAGWAQIERLVLLKSVAAEAQPMSLAALAAAGVIDPAFTHALQPQTICWIVDGRLAASHHTLTMTLSFFL